jgi:DNA-binding transcriptional regulator YdaS (Cro superfamily)
VYSSYTNGGAGAAIPPAATVIPVVNGAGLANRRLTPTQLAVLGADADDGAVRIKLSLTQIADLLGVSATYIRQARKLGHLQRHAIMRGTETRSLADLVPPRQLSLAGPELPDLRAVSDADLEQMIRAVGLERALAVAVAVEGSAAEYAD